MKSPLEIVYESLLYVGLTLNLNRTA